MGTIITLIIFSVAIIAGDVLLWRYMQRAIGAQIDDAAKAINAAQILSWKGSYDAMISEVQGIVDKIAQDTDDKFEEFAQQQNKAITAFLEGQTKVNKDYKARIEELIRKVEFHGKILKFDTDSLTGASILSMQEHELSDKNNPVSSEGYGDLRGDSHILK